MSERILVVEDDSGVRTTIVTFLELEGYAVEAVSSTRDAIDRLSKSGFPLVISDIYIDDRTGIDVLMAAKKQDPNCSVILMTARGTMETVMAARRNDAFDYLAKPFELDTLLQAVKRAIDSRQTDDDEVEPEELPESEMIGSAASMVEIYKTVALVAPTDATVVILYRQGTGGAHDPPFQQPRGASVRAGRLQRDPGCASRKRTLRRDEGRVHRRGPRPCRRDRIGQPGNRVSG
jgi:DNA-binding NtrC family response regulator